MTYLIVLLTLATFALVYDVLNVREGRTVSYWGAYLILVCLAGLRYKVGGDTYNYMYMHDLLPNLASLFSTEVGIAKLQPLWLVFSATAKSIGDDFYIFQFLHAITVNTVIFQFIQNNTRFRHTGILLYSFSLFPVFNFEILRESLAICCFLVSIRYYTNNNWIRYYLLTTLAFLFHFSAVFLYLLPFIKTIQPRTAGLFLLFIASTLLNPVVMTALASTIATQLIGFALRGYEEYNYTFFGLISIFVLYLLAPLSLTWVTQNKLKIGSQYAGIARNGLVIAACIPLFFIFYRFFNYFAILYLLMACETIHGVTRTKKFRKIKLVVLPVLFSLSVIFYTGKYFQDTSHLAASTRWYNWWYPYHSIFDPVSFPLRERMIESQNRDSHEKNR